VNTHVVDDVGSVSSRHFKNVDHSGSTGKSSSVLVFGGIKNCGECLSPDQL
jgi:hypothetical protein